MPEDQFLSVERAAEVLNCSPVTIRREIARGNLKASRFGRRVLIDPRDLKRALKFIKAYAATLGGDAA